MTTIRGTPTKIPVQAVFRKDFNTIDAQILQDANYGGDTVYSGAFVATLYYAGIIDNFQRFQSLLQYIINAETDLHNYGSGKLFTEILDEYYNNEYQLFNNTNLFGNTEPQVERDIAGKINAAISQVSNAIELIRQALDLIDTMYNRVDNVIKNMNSDYISTIERTEPLATWAYRKGLKLNPEVFGLTKLGIESKTGVNRTDLHGLLDLFDRLTKELEIMREIPVYYRTGTGGGTERVSVPIKIITVKKDESINTIATRELGSADQAIMILDFNGLTYDDIQGDDWHGRQLKIPYVNPTDSDRFSANFVLDSHAGIEALGKDLPNELIVDAGTLKVLNYTNTFAQSLNNVLLTPYGATPELPNYGSRLLQLNKDMLPTIASDALTVEATRALSTNPRVSEVLNVTTEIQGNKASILVKYQVRSINQLTEAELQANLDEL